MPIGFIGFYRLLSAFMSICIGIHRLYCRCPPGHSSPFITFYTHPCLRADGTASQRLHDVQEQAIASAAAEIGKVEAEG